MKKMIVTMLCGLALFGCTKPKEDTTQVAAPAPTPQQEIADWKYAEMGMKGIQQLSSGDIDGWMTSFADNAKYYWSGGDSLIGKPAIAAYWKERRTKVIDTISFSSDVWTPLKINVSQKGADRTGVWLLSWYNVSVTYKNKKSLKFWVHTDFHFDANDKIDQAVQYIDMSPIKAALAKK